MFGRKLPKVILECLHYVECRFSFILCLFIRLQYLMSIYIFFLCRICRMSLLYGSERAHRQLKASFIIFSGVCYFVRRHRRRNGATFSILLKDYCRTSSLNFLSASLKASEANGRIGSEKRRSSYVVARRSLWSDIEEGRKCARFFGSRRATVPGLF